MPEGHVVHRQARRINRAFKGQALDVSSPQGRFDAGAALLDGTTLRTADALGKHLLVDFEDDRTLHVHLGLYGKWTFGKGDAPEPRGQVRLRIEGDESYADLRGPTACEVLEPDQVAALVARIGPDPIRKDADPERAWKRVSRSRAPIGGLLMDQSAFAGVGNIYRAEALYRAGIDPYRPGHDVSRSEFDAIWGDLVVLMQDGVRRGRIDTVRDEHSPSAMRRAARRDRHGGEVYVYRREGQPCLVCGDEVAWSDLAGRNLYWCPTCQSS
ncbi:MAG: Fpg/Nei family DNA glycosylase [Actinomycetales bacterium]|nr:Fpg/Nei family DNA glycosylase [Actinomycetales bacterium]